MFKYYRKNFESEIEALKSEDPDSVLHPLRQAQIKQNILQQIKTIPRSEYSPIEVIRSFFEYGSSSIMQYSFVALVLFTLVGIGTIQASDNALPGDKLYGVKLTAEQLQYALTFNHEDKAKLQAKFIETRIEENSSLSAQAKSEDSERLNQAIEALHTVQIKLEERGNTQAAAQVEANVKRFEERAAELKVELNLQNSESDDEKSNNGVGEVKGQSDDKPNLHNDENNREKNQEFIDDIKGRALGL